MNSQFGKIVLLVALSVIGHTALAGDAEITLKAVQEQPAAIKYGPVITIKPKGATAGAQNPMTDPATSSRARAEEAQKPVPQVRKISPQPIPKIEPEEIDQK